MDSFEVIVIVECSIYKISGPFFLVFILLHRNLLKWVPETSYLEYHLQIK